MGGPDVLAARAPALAAAAADRELAAPARALRGDRLLRARDRAAAPARDRDRERDDRRAPERRRPVRHELVDGLPDGLGRAADGARAPEARGEGDRAAAALGRSARP